jgi:hypothetical protein
MMLTIFSLIHMSVVKAQAIRGVNYAIRLSRPVRRARVRWGIGTFSQKPQIEKSKASTHTTPSEMHAQEMHTQ